MKQRVWRRALGIFTGALGLLLAVCLLLGSIGPGTSAKASPEKHTLYFFGTFDTMITLIGYTEDQATFDRVAGEAKARFEELHCLFDAYNEYEGIQNVYTLNRDAARAPVAVEPELMGLLAFAKEWQPRLRGTVNIAMGRVLKLWHDYRELGIANEAEAKLPPMEELRAAAAGANLDSVILDQAQGTVFFADADLRLDVGTVAKGYATELVAQMLLSSDMPSFIINAGGNVRTGEPPLDGRSSWGVGIQDPDVALGLKSGDGNAEVLYLSNLSVVSSGDYERFYVVDGVRYHHIISPDTLMPATEHRAVTIVCEDSGLADILSTAVFILPYEESRALVESLEGVEAVWILEDGEDGGGGKACRVVMTDGLAEVSKSGGGSGR